MVINEVDRHLIVKEIWDLFFIPEYGFTVSKIRYNKGPKKIQFADFVASRKSVSFWCKFFGQPKNLSGDIISNNITDTKILKKLRDYRPYIHDRLNPKTDFYIAFFKTEIGEGYKQFIFKPIPIDSSQYEAIDAALNVSLRIYLKSLEIDERYRPGNFYSARIRSDFFQEVMEDLPEKVVSSNPYYNELKKTNAAFNDFYKECIGNPDNLLNAGSGNLLKYYFFVALSEINGMIS